MIDDELVASLGRDCVVSMRGRVLGGSRNVSPIPANGLVLVACGQGAGRLRTRAFVVEQCVPLLLFLLGRFCPILVLLERRVNNGVQEEFLVIQQVVAQRNVAPLRLMLLLLHLLLRCPRQEG